MMRKQFFLSLLSLITCILKAQSNKRYLKVTYIAVPLSQYRIPPQNSKDYNHYQNFTLPFGNAYKYYYTLYVDLKTKRSVYRIDSLSIGKVPKGYEDDKFTNGDSLTYVVRYNDHTFFKSDHKMNLGGFYTVGNLKEIEWRITDKTKIIYGLHCKKALPKDKDFLMNVWFTTDIAVSTGPSIFLNLPGLVVCSEDSHWTTEIENITYMDSGKLNFEKLIQSYKKDFDQNKKKNPMKEKQLLIWEAKGVKEISN